MESVPLVTVQCLVYNHEPFLRKCLDGFVMQETTFPFEVLVHDDASTDGSAAIIREYAERYPEIIKPIYETENQHSKHDGSLRRIVHGSAHPAAKYIALCEGDDYWTDAHKLQKQISFLESHPDYTMSCSRSLLYSEKDKRMVGERYCYNSTRDIKPKDVVNRTGVFISTCTIVYRKTMRQDFVEYRQLAVTNPMCHERENSLFQRADGGISCEQFTFMDRPPELAQKLGTKPSPHSRHD